MPEKTRGQLAYEAYAGTTGGRSAVSGAQLPGWHDQDVTIRTAWEAAGDAAAADGASSAWPYEAEDGTRILGPGITASPDSSAISWDGVTYALQPEPAAAATSPGRAAYEERKRQFHAWGDWADEPAEDRDRWEAVGLAVICAHPDYAAALMDRERHGDDIAALKTRLDELRETAGRARESLENTAADTSRPSKKSEIEDGCARAIRAIAAQLPAEASEP